MPSSPAVRIAAALCCATLTLWSAATLGFEAVTATGGSLVDLSALTAAFWAALLLIALPLLRRRRVLAPTVGENRRAALFCTLLVLGALLAFLSHRLYGDDTYYLGNVTYAVFNPDAPITSEVRALDATPLEPFQSLHFATAVAHDYLAAVLHRWSGLDYLHMRYLVLVPLAGATLVGALFLLLGRFIQDEDACLAATLCLIALLVLWRDSPRAFGSYAFVRLSNGKAVVMLVLLPLFSAALLRFLQCPGRLTALAIAGTALAAAGMSASAIPLFGATGIGVFGGMAVARPSEWRAYLARSLLAALLTAGFVFPLLRVLASDLVLGMDSPANEGWPATFLGHAQFMGYATYVVLPLSAAILFATGLTVGRVIVLGWAAAIVIFFLNPVIGDVLLEEVVGPNIYWRLFYTLPWIPLIGLAFVGLRARAGRALQRLVWPGLLAATLGGFALIAWMERVPPVWPWDWRLEFAGRADAEAVIAASPPGSMLAPTPISELVPILDSERPQLRLRPAASGLEVWSLAAGAPELARRRVAASDVLGTALPRLLPAEAADRLSDLAQVLNETRPASVVVALDSSNLEAVRKALAREGYRPSATTAAYEIWTP